MKKLRLLYLLIICAFSVSFFSCHNMCNDLENVIGAESWYDSMQWEDVSEKQYSFSMSKNYRMSKTESNTIEAYGSGNWVIGYQTKGFEASVKLNENSGNAGFQLWSTKVDSRYDFLINNKGDFYISYYEKENGVNHWKKELCRKKTAVTCTEYNTIKVALQSDRTLAVYLNGEYVCTISDTTFSFGSFCVQNSPSKSGTSAYFKIKKLLQ